MHKKWMDANAVMDDKEPATLVETSEEQDESDGSVEATTQEDEASGDDDPLAEGEAAKQDAPSVEQDVELLPQEAGVVVKSASPSNAKGHGQKKGQPKQAEPKEPKNAAAKGAVKSSEQQKKDSPKAGGQLEVQPRVKKRSKRKSLDSQGEGEQRAVSVSHGHKKLKLSIHGYNCINTDVFPVHVLLILIACVSLAPYSFSQGCSVNINAPVSGPGEVEARVDAHYDELNSVIGKFSVGRHLIPVSLIQSPEEKYRARVAKPENVDNLEKSLLSFGSVNELVEVVLFIPPNKSLPPKNGFKPPQTTEEMKARGMEGYFTVCGDHTQRAMNQLHARFKNNPKWASLSCTVYVCQRTPENYAYLKSWGILDNVKGEKRVAVSFLDKLVALHQDFESLAEFDTQSGHKERTSQVKSQRCKDFDISSGQLGQLWSLASRTGPVWDLLMRIITGDVTPPVQLKSSSNRRAGGGRARLKTVNSAAGFTNIGGLDDVVLVPLLQSVVKGQLTLQKLGDKCALIKARMRVQTAVLSDVNVNEESWTEAQVKFPLACQDSFVERWAEAVVRQRLLARAPLPDTFYTELERRIASDSEAAEARPRASSQVHCHPLILMR